jgi:small basic protein
MIAVLALIAGVVLGIVFEPTVPVWLLPYLPIAIVAALDAVFGGVRARLDGIFDDKQFVISFISNVLVAALIVYSRSGWWSCSESGSSATWRRSAGTCSGRR